MNDNGTALPERLQEIIEDFRVSSDQEKLELLLEYADRLPPLPDHLRGQPGAMEPVDECMTEASVYAETRDGRITFYFDVPPEAPTVRGYASLLHEGVRDLPPDAVLRIPGDFFQELGLQRVLSPQRLNGITAILAHMKRLALQSQQQIA